MRTADFTFHSKNENGLRYKSNKINSNNAEFFPDFDASTFVESFPQNLTADINWVSYNSSHLLPTVNWTLSNQLNQPSQSNVIDIDPDLLRLKSDTIDTWQADTASTSTVKSSSPSSEDFNFEIE